MALRMEGLQRVWIHAPEATRTPGSMEPRFETEGRETLVALRPLTGEVRTERFGEQERERLWLFTEDRRKLETGAGIARTKDGPCAYRVVAPAERWGTHQRAKLEKL